MSKEITSQEVNRIAVAMQSVLEAVKEDPTKDILGIALQAAEVIQEVLPRPTLDDCSIAELDQLRGAFVELRTHNYLGILTNYHPVEKGSGRGGLAEILVTTSGAPVKMIVPMSRVIQRPDLPNILRGGIPTSVIDEDIQRILPDGNRSRIERELSDIVTESVVEHKIAPAPKAAHTPERTMQPPAAPAVVKEPEPKEERTKASRLGKEISLEQFLKQPNKTRVVVPTKFGYLGAVKTRKGRWMMDETDAPANEHHVWEDLLAESTDEKVYLEK